MAQTIAARRILAERKEIEATRSEYADIFRIEFNDQNARNMKATIYGPSETPYEGYEFDLEITLMEDYPRSPPNVKYLTRIQHLNVNEQGDICVDIFQKNWSPTSKISAILISLQSLLSDPNPASPLNSELGKLHSTNHDEYERVIRSACKTYARERPVTKA